jgi:predicted nucleic acid-binding Zn ribbon protein
LLAWDRQCPSCGDLVPLDSAACERCGHPLAQSSTETRAVHYQRGWRHIVRLLVALTVVLTAAVFSAFSCGSFDASALIPGGVIALAWIVIVSIPVFAIRRGLKRGGTWQMALLGYWTLGIALVLSLGSSICFVD